MINIRKVFLFLGVLSLVFLLGIETTESKSLTQESSRIEGQSSGDNSIPDDLKDADDDFNDSEMGSGNTLVRQKPKSVAQSSVFTDKQVDRLVQAEDLGKGEALGSGENAIPEFKEANDGSGEVIEMENLKNLEKQTQNTIENFEKSPSTIQSSVSNPATEPTIVTGGQATAGVQPNAQVFNDASQAPAYNPTIAQQTTGTQAYAAQSTPNEQYYNGAAASQTAPATQYYNDATAQATQAAQPDASQQATSQTAQYYNDDAASQTAPAAQQGVQAYASQPQNDAMQAPQAVDAAIEDTHPGAQTANYVPSVAANPAEVQNNAEGMPQSVDAAALATPQQTQQYYNAPTEQTAPQQTTSNDLASSFMANAASQPIAQQQQQPLQYNGNEAQAYTNPATQAFQGSDNGFELRKQDMLDENKFRTVVCQNNQDTIMCPQGKKINITDAHYGSMGESSCQGPQNTNFLPMQPCETPNAYKIVKTSCDDMDNCMLSANDGIFGEQCQSDKKYLDVAYDCVDKEPPQTQQQQYMYPGYGQGNQYAYPQQQQQQEQQQLNDEPAKINPPPPPKIPQLMSTLVQLSKNKQKYGYLDDRPSCSSCTKCNQCYKSPICAQCGLCQSKLCDQAIASLPMIPKDVRPLWEQWSERTADMNSMEMSGLIFESPKKWLKKLGVHIGGSKRSHINTHKKGDKKTLKKVTKKQS